MKQYYAKTPNYKERKGYGALSQEAKNALARTIYENVWRKVSGAYGAEGQPAPNVEMSPVGLITPPQYEGGTTRARVQSEVDELPSNSAKKVVLSPGLVEGLTRKRRGHAKQEAMRTLIHEFNHIYQNPDIYKQTDDRELGAVTAAEYITKKYLGIAPSNPEWQKLAKKFASKYGKGSWRQGQFNTNVGKNPQEIH